ncbi:hypothetical protein QTI66_31280 [Variovorax sp. J22R133]|uniref:hypothetical protein n=1 Tax=Variovorax brevis TaxID=3053503 RepID=UPI0025753699|nr:hypothetical protein [Variovorax sp. J22R133]MDM0116625.1 hypothetical protein [Variovorax sp. J22R133]
MTGTKLVPRPTVSGVIQILDATVMIEVELPRALIDQFFRADRIGRPGVADRPVNAKKMNRSELMRCMTFAERDVVRARAINLGSSMSGEEELGSAVFAVERLFAAAK